MKRLATLALGLLLTPVGSSAQQVAGPWLSETRTPNGLSRMLELSGDGRVRLTRGITIGEQWKVQERKGNRYIVQILDPATGTRVEALELTVGKGDKPDLTQRNLESGDAAQMGFVSRGNQPEDPGFLGRWEFILEDLGVRAFYEYTDDGWRWLRAPLEVELGTYVLDGGRIVPTWPTEYVTVSYLLPQGPVLTAVAPDGSEERYLRPKMVMAKTGPPPPLPEGVTLTLPTIHRGSDLLERQLWLELDKVGEVGRIRLADCHPTPGPEIAITGDRGVNLVATDGSVLQTLEVPEPLGLLEMVDVDGDGRCEIMSRGGGGHPAGLLDASGRILWLYSPELGANDMAVGDLDGDAELDFVVGCNGGEGIHRLDHEGRPVWRQSDDNVLQVEIVTFADGSRRVVHTNAGAEIVWRDAAGEALRRGRFDSEPPTFSLFDPDQPTEPARLISIDRQENSLRILALTGELEREIDLFAPEGLAIRGFAAQPIRFRPSGPWFDAVVLRLRRDSRADAGAVLLYDRTGKLVFEEMIDRAVSTLAVIPGTAEEGARLLVGGIDEVWEYRWVGD